MKLKKNLLRVGLAAALTSAVFATSAFAEELTVWFSDVGPQNELPEDEWLINLYARQFEEENPGTTINIVYQADQAVAQNKMKAAVTSDTAPDIINMYSGYMVTYYKDIFTDITEYVPEEDLEHITSWSSVREGMKDDGAILGYPEAGNELGIILYNKELCEQAGVDLAACKTAQEFKDALLTIKDAGIQAMIASDSGFNSFWMFGTGAWWTQMSGTDRVLSNGIGETKFVDDTGFIDTMNFAASFYSDGILNVDYLENQDAFQTFLSGDAATYPSGNWDIPNAEEALGDKLGIMCVPAFDGTDNTQIGGCGQAWCVLKTCKNPELAVKFLSYISQKDYVLEQAKIIGKVPQRDDITAEELGWAGNENYEYMLEACKNVTLWNDNVLQTDVANEYYNLTGQVIAGMMTAEECAEELDTVAEEAAE